jgi:exonuclease SbcD
MKFAHISDLHIGKRIHGFSMVDDQRYILEQITRILKDESVHGLLIAGDVYDKNVPNEDAVDLLDDFLTNVSDLGCPVYMIAGNHDSAERLAFGNRMLKKSRVHITDKFSGKMEHIECEDEYGKLNLYLLPYIKPSSVQPYFKEKIPNPDEAFKNILKATSVDPLKRNVLLSHQFIVGSGITLKTSDSEERRPTIGGLDCISSYLMEPFDYVALGHIHRPQAAGRPSIRYCGSPLKYSLSEINDIKSVTVIEIKDKNSVDIRTIPLIPRREMRKIKGTFKELFFRTPDVNESKEDYIFATLTEQVIDAVKRLSGRYPNLMDVRVEEESALPDDNPILKIEGMKSMDAEELFGDFFEKINGKPMTDSQRKMLAYAIEKAEEEAQQ